MRPIPLIAALLTAFLVAPAYAEESEAKEWCNDAHMQKMDDMIAKMTDAAKKKEAETHLSMSRTAMQSGDMTGCVDHMKQAHLAMGL